MIFSQGLPKTSENTDIYIFLFFGFGFLVLGVS